MPLPCTIATSLLVAEDLGDVLAQPTGRGAGVELGLHHDLAADDVQAAGEPEHRRDLGLAAAGLGDVGVGELRLHLSRHRHGADPATRVNNPRPSRWSRRELDAVREDRGVRRGELARDRGAAMPSSRGDVGDDAAGRRTPRPAPRARRASSVAGRLDAVDQHGVERQVGRVVEQDGEVVGGGVPLGLAVLGLQVEDDDEVAVGLDERLGAATAPSGAGSTEVNHEPGPSTTQSASRMASTASGHGRSSAGSEGDRLDGAVGGGHRHLAAHGGEGRRGRRGRARSPRR